MLPFGIISREPSRANPQSYVIYLFFDGFFAIFIPEQAFNNQYAVIRTGTGFLLRVMDEFGG